MSEHHLRTVRRARYHVLGDPSGATEVWIVIHGYGQLAGEFITGFGSLARPGRIVVAPEALNRYYKDEAARSHASAAVGTTWMTRMERENEIADYVDWLDLVATTVMQPGTALTVLGFSQGVATAVRWLSMGRTRASRLILWAGNLPADVDPATLRSRLPGPGLELVVGSVDEYVEWIRVDHQRALLEAAGFEVTLTIFDGGHRLDRETIAVLGA